MGRTHDVTISAFDLDRLEAELAAVTEQRDRMAEALRHLMTHGGHHQPVLRDTVSNIAKQALATVKG